MRFHGNPSSVRSADPHQVELLLLLRPGASDYDALRTLRRMWAGLLHNVFTPPPPPPPRNSSDGRVCVGVSVCVLACACRCVCWHVTRRVVVCVVVCVCVCVCVCVQWRGKIEVFYLNLRYHA
ncbi:unnamed protein product [Arctogadus glacialis]